MIYRALRNNKAGYKWEKILGYTLADLVVHLERQFVLGMTWVNYGKAWEVDHIVPLCAFSWRDKDDPELKAAWALTNLRPLWAKKNREKSGTRFHLL